MGMTFTTIQIKNQKMLTMEQFTKAILQYMESKGFGSTSAEDAEFSCCLAFADKSAWGTLCLESDVKSIHEEAEGLAKALQTYCIVTSCWDSDMIELHLYGASDNQKDTIMAGRMPWEESPGDPPAPRGKQKQWEPLLIEAAAWLQLSIILDNTYVFAEDAFFDIAPLFGMDSKSIIHDYQYWEEIEPNNPNVFKLHFKNVQSLASMPLLLSEGATKLMLVPPILVSGVKNFAKFSNIGGISKGLTICFVGECFKNDEVEISELEIERLINPKKGRSNSSYPDDYDFFKVPLKKINYADGRDGLAAFVNGFVFSEGINLDHPSIAGNKRYSKRNEDLWWSFETLIRFTARLNSDEDHKFVLCVAPQENPIEGQSSKNVRIYKQMNYVEMI